MLNEMLGFAHLTASKSPIRRKPIFDFSIPHSAFRIKKLEWNPYYQYYYWLSVSPH